MSQGEILKSGQQKRQCCVQWYNDERDEFCCEEEEKDEYLWRKSDAWNEENL